MSPREKIVNTNMEYEVRAMCKVFNALDDASTVSAHGGQHSNVMELPYRPHLCIHAGIGKEYTQKEIKSAPSNTPFAPAVALPHWRNKRWPAPKTHQRDYHRQR